MYGALTLYGGTFQSSSANTFDLLFQASQTKGLTPLFGRLGGGPTTPTGKPVGLGSSAFARRYLRNLFDFFSSG